MKHSTRVRTTRLKLQVDRRRYTASSIPCARPPIAAIVTSPLKSRSRAFQNAWLILVVSMLGLLSACKGHTTENPGPAANPSFQDLIYPLTEGTQWSYSYYYLYGYGADRITEEHRGVRIWTVYSVSTTANSRTAFVTTSLLDTVHYVQLALNPAAPPWIDTTYVDRRQGSFSIVSLESSVTADWVSTMQIPRQLSVASRLALGTVTGPLVHDTLAVDVSDPQGSQAVTKAWYANGIGLLSYSGRIIRMQSYVESLTLVEFSRK